MGSNQDKGADIYALAKKLWGLNRSITGEGVRATLGIINGYLPDLAIKGVASGMQVFDWTVPKEWAVEVAYIIDPNGEKICSFRNNNLHLVGYSTPIDQVLTLSELQQHLYSLPDQPSAIPYVTSYYRSNWGFCISQDERNKLKEGEYRVVIKSRLFDGVLNYGELLIEGDSKEEIFLSSYICHPSMANNELSGPTVLTYLVIWLLGQKKLRYSYRIVFIPETIGSITYLSKHYRQMKDLVVAGFNISCVGDDRAYSYLPSRNGNTLSDVVAQHVLKWIDPGYQRYTWSDRGSDERQYCAPGIDLPIASICRTKYASYPEYHTSLDDLENVVIPEGLQGGYNALRRALEALEKNVTPRVTVLCEPQLGKRGLYPDLSIKGSSNQVQVMMDFISWCDGNHTLLEISEIINVPIWELYDVCAELEGHKLLEIVDA
jgi:aminopeptidase-like protein